MFIILLKTYVISSIIFDMQRCHSRCLFHSKLKMIEEQAQIFQFVCILINVTFVAEHCLNDHEFSFCLHLLCKANCPLSGHLSVNEICLCLDNCPENLATLEILALNSHFTETFRSEWKQITTTC